MTKIIGNSLPNMPWQDKPAGEIMPVWRYDANPIIGRYDQQDHDDHDAARVAVDLLYDAGRSGHLLDC